MPAGQPSAPPASPHLPPDVQVHFIDAGGLSRGKRAWALFGLFFPVAILVLMALNMSRLAFLTESVTVVITVLIVLVSLFGLGLLLLSGDHSYVRTVALRICPDLSESALKALSSAGKAGSGGFPQNILRHLPATRRMNLVAVIDRAQWEGTLHPITVPFEPTLLDEDEPAFANLESAESPVDAGSVERSSDAPFGHGRRVNWYRQIGILIFLAVMLLNVALRLKDGDTTFAALFLLTILLLLFFARRTRRGSLRQRQWLIVPGGVVVRVPRGWRGASELRLYTRAESVLFAIGHLQRSMVVHISGARRSTWFTMTDREARLLLRAWLSPLPPPPLEQLADFR